MLKEAALYRKFETVFDDRQAALLAQTITEAYTDLVKTSDFNELKEIVRDLAQAQERTEARLEDLTQAQTSLAQAQERTEAAVEKLAQAQGRTETAMEKLTIGLADTRRGGPRHGAFCWYRVLSGCYIIEGYRDSVIYHIPLWKHPGVILYFWVVSMIIMLAGMLINIRLRPHFADVI